MTLSVSEREQNLKQALAIMLDELGDTPLQMGYFDSRSPSFAQIHSTTWVDLVHGGFTKVVAGSFHQPTGRGWRKAMQITDRINEPSFRNQFAAFLAYLKRFVKGRQQDALVDLRKAAKELGIPFGWLCNAVESELVEHLCDGRQGPYWHSEQASGIVVVPRNFYMLPLP